MITKFIKDNRFTAILFFGLALLSLVSWAYLHNNPETDNQTPDIAYEDKHVVIEEDNPAAADDLSLTATTPDETTPTSPPSSSPLATSSLRVPEYFTLYVEEREYQPIYRPATSLYELMTLMTADSRLPFSFTTKEYSGMGYFVEGINGKPNDSLAGMYWIYEINGQPATVGVSQYIVQKNDIITWRYIKI